MNNFKNKLKDRTTVIPNELIINKNISWKAKGIFSYLASKDDTWQFRMTEIVQHSPGGMRSLQSGIKELEDAGYLIREVIRHPKTNKFIDWKWTVTTPIEEAWAPHVSR